MAKKLLRVYPDRRLTLEEIASDQQLRERVSAEFPPNRAPGRPQSSSLSDVLRRSILESAKSVDQIAGESGVSAVLIAGFLAGQRDIHLITADKLASALGLEVAVD